MLSTSVCQKPDPYASINPASDIRWLSCNKFFSTRPLTVLVIGAIVQLEQRERNKKEPNPQFEQLATLETTSRVLVAAAESGS